MWGLLGAPSRSGPVRRSLAEGSRQGQARAGHRRLHRHRQGAGASAGAGRRDHHRLRPDAAALKATREFAHDGLTLHTYSADIADPEACAKFVSKVIADHGGIDILVNNAGRSIRRSIEHSYDRPHDLERTKVNYFGAVQVTMGFLAGMAQRREGHVVNVSSIGVLTNAPRFSAYVASKAALESWSNCAARSSSTGNPLHKSQHAAVRTEMIVRRNSTPMCRRSIRRGGGTDCRRHYPPSVAGWRHGSAASDRSCMRSCPTSRIS